jgi:hypothetical protein
MNDTTVPTSMAADPRSVEPRSRRRPILQFVIAAAAGLALVMHIAGDTSAQSDRTPSEVCEWADGSYSPACRMSQGVPDGWFRAPDGEASSTDASQADSRYR